MQLFREKKIQPSLLWAPAWLRHVFASSGKVRYHADLPEGLEGRGFLIEVRSNQGSDKGFLPAPLACGESWHHCGVWFGGLQVSKH